MVFVCVRAHRRPRRIKNFPFSYKNYQKHGNIWCVHGGHVGGLKQ